DILLQLLYICLSAFLNPFHTACYRHSHHKYYRHLLLWPALPRPCSAAGEVHPDCLGAAVYHNKTGTDLTAPSLTVHPFRKENRRSAPCPEAYPAFHCKLQYLREKVYPVLPQGQYHCLPGLLPCRGFPEARQTIPGCRICAPALSKNYLSMYEFRSCLPPYNYDGILVFPSIFMLLSVFTKS